MSFSRIWPSFEPPCFDFDDFVGKTLLEGESLKILSTELGLGFVVETSEEGSTWSLDDMEGDLDLSSAFLVTILSKSTKIRVSY